jgi:hypothetical protein
MNINDVVTLIVNNGVAVGLLSYFVYRDNKFMNSLDVTLKALQMSVDSVKSILDKSEVKKE